MYIDGSQNHSLIFPQEQIGMEQLYQVGFWVISGLKGKGKLKVDFDQIVNIFVDNFLFLSSDKKNTINKIFYGEKTSVYRDHI